jgi:hypothetical protein
VGIFNETCIRNGANPEKEGRTETKLKMFVVEYSRRGVSPSRKYVTEKEG